MLTSGRRFCTAALASLAVAAASASMAHAQRLRFFNNMYPGIINPSTGISANPMIGPGLTLQQYAYNVRTVANAYSSIPPYMYGYNPYPSPIYNSGTLYSGGYNPALYGGYGNPYLTTGYGGYGAYAGNPYLTTTPGYGSSLTTTPGYGTGGYDSSLTTNPYAGNPYAGYPYGDPASQTINSVANLQNSTAQYYLTIQRAKLLQEEVSRSRLETRRKQDEYERQKREQEMKAPEYIQKSKEVALNTARRDPTLTDVVSGDALNVLLVHLQDQQNKGFRGPNVPLDEIDLSLVNVKPEGENVNIGLIRNLKQGDKLAWPTVLIAEAFAEPRTKLDARLPDAVNKLRVQKPVPEEDIVSLEESVKKMSETLNASINDLSPTQYITAKRFLGQLQDAIRAMKTPSAINYFNGTWVAKGKNVAELVNNMRTLRFAPATPGGEGTYRALHQAFVAFDANMTLISAPK